MTDRVSPRESAARAKTQANTKLLSARRLLHTAEVEYATASSALAAIDKETT